MNEKPSELGSSGSTNRRGWLPGATALLAFVSCNGTIVLIGLFSLFGLTLVVDPHVQAAAIAAFSVFTAALVAIDRKRHGHSGPFVVAALAILIIVGTLYVAYDKAVETVGLASLFGAAIWNWRLVRCHRQSADPSRR